jgi:hypothetical protein
VAVTTAAALTAGVHVPHASAGTYSVSIQTKSEVTGWTRDMDDGMIGCSISYRPADCVSSDIPAQPALSVYAYGSASNWANGSWQLVAPPTTNFVSGSLSVTYKTTNADVDVFMKAFLLSETKQTSPVLYDSTADGSATWPIPSGNQVLAANLRSKVAHTFTDRSANWLRVNSIAATLRDDTPPVLTVAGPLADGSWHAERQPVCVDTAATDAGSGVATVTLYAPDGTPLAGAQAPVTSWIQPGATDETASLCTIPAALGDGVHTLSVVARDAAGESSTKAVVVRVDATAPVLTAAVPAADTQSLRPPVSVTFDPGPSGIAALTADLDGVPMSVTGTTARIDPQTDLGYGAHTVSYHAVDVAGNSRDGTYTFRVVDGTPPEISAQAPVAGSSTQERRPQLGFTVTDAGVGIDPTTLRVALDGVEISSGGTLTGGVFTYAPQTDLAYGQHRLRVSISDRSGNAMAPAEWTFTVADVTAPTISDVRPDPGTGTADRRPAVSATVADDGIGIDPATVHLLIDGADVTADATLSGGRITYQPTTALAYGSHTATVQVRDRAGNSATPLSWSFQVLDQQPPAVSNQLPVDGSTVAGATAIGFDLADSGGVGVDTSTLHVTVDGSDVTSWGTLTGLRFRYTPGNLGAGVHTVTVNVSDLSGNATGGVSWQFAVADPATLGIGVRSAPAAIVAGAQPVLAFAVTSNGAPLAGARVELRTRAYGQAEFGPARLLVADAGGVVSTAVHPTRQTSYQLTLADDPSVSVVHVVSVHRAVTVRSAAAAIRRGGVVLVSGAVTPFGAGQRVSIQALTARGWVTVAQPRVGTRGGYSQLIAGRTAGWYTLRTVAPALPGSLGGTSRTIRLHVL